MKSTHIDGDDQVLSEYLLENGIQVEIVRKKTADKKEFSPLFRQVSSFVFIFCFMGMTAMNIS